MALLPTGTTGVEKSDYPLDELCCPPDLEFEYDCPVKLLCDGALTVPRDATTCDSDEDAVSLEDGLNLLDQVQCHVTLGGGGALCQVPSPPLSDCSSDSGVLGSVQSSEETFFTGLFGSDFLQNPQVDMYSPTPSLSDQSASTKVDTVFDRNRKNAEAARQNRMKKKKYVEGLEKDSSTLRTENVILKTKCHEYQTRCQRLQSEVDYLKSVLANESVLASLIQNIPSVPGVRLTSSFRKRAHPESRSSDSGACTSGAAKKFKFETSAGVCLHLSKNAVSLEFCENCSKQASTL